MFQKASGGCYGVMHSRKHRKSNVLTRDLMSKMLNEDRENVFECRYGQLSSTEQIEKNKTATKQNDWPCICRAAINQKLCCNVYNLALIRSLFAQVNQHFLIFNKSRRFHSLLCERLSRLPRSRGRLVANVLIGYFRLLLNKICVTNKAITNPLATVYLIRGFPEANLAAR